VRNGVLTPNDRSGFSALLQCYFRFTAVKKTIHRSDFVTKC